MDIIHFAQSRYTTKSFDPDQKLSAQEVEKIETLLRFSPSSTNMQPWHFLMTGTESGKSRIAKSTSGFYAFNESKVLNASHVVVLCTRTILDTPYQQVVLEQEARDGRFPSEEARKGMERGRAYFVNAHRFELRDAAHWADKQVYLALGTLLLGAATLGIDACPIEGFDAKILNEELGLYEQGLLSTVIVALGHRAQDDFNANLPKSRLPADKVITRF